PANQPDALQVPSAAIAFIESRQGFARTFTANASLTGFLPTPDVSKLIPVKLGMMTGLSLISDYEPLFHARSADLLRHLSGQQPAAWSAYQGPLVSQITPSQWPLLRVLGTRFILLRDDAGIGVADLSPVFAGGGYVVYELPEPLPRAYV